MSRPPTPIIKRFFNFVEKTDSGCWEWTGAISSGGYGQICTQHGKFLRAHRFYWEFINGPIPKGLFACHKCDNRRCVNLKHIFIGTQKQNIQDCIKKKRWPSIGQTHGMAILSENEVREIRKRYIPYKVKAKSLAKEFHVSEHAIRDIVNRTAWKHVP